MTAPDLADVWRQAMKRAGQLRPDAIGRAILESAETGLRASRFDSNGGGRTTRVPCPENEYRTCRDGGPEPHSHLVTSDPTGNAATRGARRDTSTDELRRLNQASLDFVKAASEVIVWVSGDLPETWQEVLTINARLMPGTVQAGIDVDDDYRLPPAIKRVDKAVGTVAAIAREHLPRTPSQDEQHWTAGLADEDCCSWHLSIHRRYRRPKVGAYKGEHICSDCMALVLAGESRPPQWLLEAEIDSGAKPKAWHAALSRWLDELGVVRSA